MRDHNIGAYRCRTFFHPEVGRRLRGERFPKLVRVFRKQRGKRSLVRATCGGQLREQVDCVEELAGAGVTLEGWPPLDGGGRLREREQAQLDVLSFAVVYTPPEGCPLDVIIIVMQRLCNKTRD
jgi:hypothetical protein